MTKIEKVLEIIKEDTHDSAQFGYMYYLCHYQKEKAVKSLTEMTCPKLFGIEQDDNNCSGGDCEECWHEEYEGDDNDR